jgi:molybdopterin converting factor small subunit
MKLRVRYTAQLRTAAGRADDEVELPDGSSVAALLGHVAEKLGSDAAMHLLSPGGHAPPGLLVVLNDEAVTGRSAATTLLRPGDVVTLLPPIAGG